MAMATGPASTHITPDPRDKGTEIGSMSFNRDGSYLSVGTSESWMHIACVAADKPQQISSGKSLPVRLISRLGRSCLVALVTIANPRKLVIINSAKNEAICNYAYKDTILTVSMSQTRLVVCLTTKIYIHELASLKLLQIIDFEATPNPKGIMSLTQDEPPYAFLAYPNSDVRGDVHIFDIGKLETWRVILAMEDPISLLQFSGTGALLAVSSENGTQIMVYDMEGTRLHHFHRGLMAVDIYSMSFSQNEGFLAVTSSNPTVHIFRLQEKPTTDEDKKECPPSPSPPKQQSTTAADGESWTDWNSWVDWAKTTVLPMLPSISSIPLPEMLTYNRSFASLVTPGSRGFRSIVNLTTAYGEDGPEGRVVVASFEGFLYIYRLNTIEGGECELIKQVHLLALMGDTETED